MSVTLTLVVMEVTVQTYWMTLAVAALKAGLATPVRKWKTNVRDKTVLIKPPVLMYLQTSSVRKWDIASFSKPQFHTFTYFSEKK